MVIEYLMSRFRSQKWKGVIGLEIHAQINTESKLFSGAEKNFGSPTNSNVTTDVVSSNLDQGEVYNIM
jgi:Asp-tRNA(Asn)/Glu-tRNA(Gln) amidotransferase B subunit